MKSPVYEIEFLSKPFLGIYTITTYYDDGSIETREVPKGLIVAPKITVMP